MKAPLDIPTNESVFKALAPMLSVLDLRTALEQLSQRDPAHRVIRKVLNSKTKNRRRCAARRDKKWGVA